MNSLSENCTSREIKCKYTIKALINRLPRIRPSPSYKRNKINKLHHIKKNRSRVQVHALSIVLVHHEDFSSMAISFSVITCKVKHWKGLFDLFFWKSEMCHRYSNRYTMRMVEIWENIPSIKLLRFHSLSEIIIVQQHILWQHTCILVVRLVISKLIFQVRFKLSKNPMKNCKESSLEDLHFMAV